MSNVTVHECILSKNQIFLDDRGLICDTVDCCYVLCICVCVCVGVCVSVPVFSQSNPMSVFSV